MMKFFNRFCKFPVFVQLILLLCVLGMFINVILLVRDVSYGVILWRLHFGFFILYMAQVVFILAEEKWVCLLTLLQGIMALLTTADFIFVPLLQAMGWIYYWLFDPSMEATKVYQYLFISIAFTLQLASAGYLWGYLRKK